MCRRRSSAIGACSAANVALGEKTSDATEIASKSYFEQAHLKLSCVVSDGLGGSGRRILRALLDRVTDPDKLALLTHRKILATKEEIAEALRGNLTCSQHLALQKHLDSIERIEADIADLETELAKQQAAQQPVGVRAAQQIISQIGPNADAFATAGKLASWVGACPGMCESGGVSMSSRCAKANPYLRRLFCQIAWAATMAKDSPSRHKYHKLKSRLGPQKAIWAVAHYLVRLVWTIFHSRYPLQKPRTCRSRPAHSSPTRHFPQSSTGQDRLFTYHPNLGP